MKLAERFRQLVYPRQLDDILRAPDVAGDVLRKVKRIARVDDRRGNPDGRRGTLYSRLFGATVERFAPCGIIDFQDSLEEIENQIQMARRYYNGAVRNLNVTVESFPSNLVAQTFSFQQAEYFELEDEGQRALPKVEF